MRLWSPEHVRHSCTKNKNLVGQALITENDRFVVKIHPQALPAVRDNKLYLDYIAGTGIARSFFTHSPLDFAAALAGRRRYVYPRQEVALCLGEYNAKLGAHSRALQNIDALADSSTFCVISGQQAGFLGGPAYAAYKIVTTIRLAEHLQASLPARFVPVFWLATEDHDFAEINHAYFLRRDGEVGLVKFGWEREGNSITDLPLSNDVKRAYEDYFDTLLPGAYFSQARELFSLRVGEDFGTWQARTWSQLFSERGLVIVEPHLLRKPARDFFSSVLEREDEIGRRLSDVAQQLDAAGYVPALDPQQYGRLFTFDSSGRRVRVANPRGHIKEVTAYPEHYSTDAALRPLLADITLPVVVSVLGPGETAYHAMLKPLYELFNLPQPLFLPRKSYTIVARAEAESIARYRTSVNEILTEQLNIDATFQNLVPEPEREMFALAHRAIEDALAPLRPYLENIDPSLGRTWAQTVHNSIRGLSKLQERATKARMSQLGFSKQELRALQNALLPRGRLQERVFPLPYFINRHGKRFIDELFVAGSLDDFAHHILILEDNGG